MKQKQNRWEETTKGLKWKRSYQSSEEYLKKRRERYFLNIEKRREKANLYREANKERINSKRRERSLINKQKEIEANRTPLDKAKILIKNPIYKTLFNKYLKENPFLPLEEAILIFYNYHIS